MAEEEKTEDVKDESEAGEGEEQEASPKKSKKKLIIIVAAAVLLLGGGAGVFFSGLLGGGDHKEEEEVVNAGPVYVTLPEILVNLNTGNKKISFIKTTIALELSSEKDATELELYQPRIIDAFNTYLREVRASDLHGSAGTYRLREELLLRANKVADPIKIENILFREILIQ